MKNILFAISLCALLPSLYGQTLLVLDGVQLTTDNTTTFYIEGGILLKNESLIRNGGTLNLGSSGSGFTPIEANWVNNNIAEPGQDVSAGGHVRLLLNGSRITGTLPSSIASNFNHIWLDASNGVNWLDTDAILTNGLHLGNSTLEVNNRILTIENMAPATIDASGGGAIRLESAPPLPSPNQWSLVQWLADTNPQIYAFPLRSASGEDLSVTFSTLASASPEFVALSTYGTGQNNQPLPASFFGNPAIDDNDLDGNGSDDSDNMADRFWMIHSPNKPIANLEFQIPASEASTGNLTATSSLNAFYFDGDWNFPGTGSGDALTGVNVTVNSALIRTYALGNLAINLPIECIAFTGMQEGHSVKLEWETASETNNIGFEIQRSTDGITYDQIGFVQGQGTTAEPQLYSFTDETAFPERDYYYRLLQRDLDGNTQLACGVVRVNLDGSFGEDLIYVAPNPAISQTTVFIPENLIGSILTLSTIDGKVLREIPVSSPQILLKRLTLPSGMYFLKIENKASGQFANTIKVVFVD